MVDTVECLGAGIVDAERRAGRLVAFPAIGIEEVRLEEAAACVEASEKNRGALRKATYSLWRSAVRWLRVSLTLHHVVRWGRWRCVAKIGARWWRTTNLFLDQFLRELHSLGLPLDSKVSPGSVVTGRVRLVLRDLAARLVLDRDDVLASLANHGASFLRRNWVVDCLLRLQSWWRSRHLVRVLHAVVAAMSELFLIDS